MRPRQGSHRAHQHSRRRILHRDIRRQMGTRGQRPGGTQGWTRLDQTGGQVMDPMDVYNAIVRLGGARLDQLVDELKPASQSTISRLIRRLVNQEMIHRIGYEWFPRVRDLTELGSGAGTQLSQVSQV